MNCSNSEFTITEYIGSDWNFTFTLTDETVDPAVAVDITGYTFWFTIRADESSTANIIEIKNVDPHFDPDAGITIFSISDTQTELLVAGKTYVYSIVMLDTSNNRTVIRTAPLIPLSPAPTTL